MQLAEVLLPEAKQGCAKHLRGTADEVVHLWLERSAVTVVPGLGRDIVILHEDCRHIPVPGLAFEPVAALEDQDVLARGSELSRKGAAAGSASDDDDVETLVHTRSACKRCLPAVLEPDAALHDAAIRKDGGGGKVACAVPACESDDAGDLLRARHAPERYRCVQFGELGGVVHGEEIDWCRHRPGAHADDEDVVFGELDACGAGEHAHAAFGQTIGGVAGHRPILMHRGDVDNAATAALLDHLLGRNLRAEEGALQVDGQYLLVLSLSGFKYRGAGFDASIIHHDIDAAEPADCGVDESLQIRGPAHIGVDADRLIAELGDLLLERVGRFGMNHVVDDDTRSLPSEFENDGFADPAVASRDDGNLAVQ